MKRYLTTKEVAHYLNVSPTTLKLWRHQGIGPQYAKVGQSVRYDSEELERYIKGHTYGSTAEYEGQTRGVSHETLRL